MLIIAFVAFFILVLAWLMAPAGEIEAAPVAAPTPNLTLGEASPA